MLLSECCGADPDYTFSVFDDAGICSNCLDHCDFKEDEEDD